METFFDAYVTCALWSSTDNSRDDGGDPFDANYDIEDIDLETLMNMRTECDAFEKENETLLTRAYETDGYSEAQAGHDFWLTRNHHGAGFWDRGLDSVGDRLSDLAHACGERDLYLGDDGKIHQA